MPKEVSDVRQRRACNGKLPVENRAHNPSAVSLADDDVALPEVAMHQSRLAPELRELVGSRPYRSVDLS